MGFLCVALRMCGSLVLGGGFEAASRYDTLLSGMLIK